MCRLILVRSATAVARSLFLSLRRVRALDAGCKFAGATVHLVTAELDHGPILAQAVVPVLPDDTADTLAARVLTQEHRIYPQAVALLLQQ